MGARIFLLMTALAVVSSAAAIAGETTVDGTVTMGSSAGLIGDKKHEFAYDGQTRNLSVLTRACPVRMGEETPCVVSLQFKGTTATAIISARPPAFGKPINKPGSVFDTEICDEAANVDTGSQACKHFDELQVEVLAMKGPVSKLRWNGMIRYAPSQRVLINCHGTSVSLASYIGRNLPPGMKSC